MNELNTLGKLDSDTFLKLVACVPIEKRSNHDELANILLNVLEKGTHISYVSYKL